VSAHSRLNLWNRNRWPPPDASDAEHGRAFDALLDGRRIREDLGFKPDFPRLADALTRSL